MFVRACVTVWRIVVVLYPHSFVRFVCDSVCRGLKDPSHSPPQDTKAHVASVSGVTKSLFVRSAENMTPQLKLVRVFCNHQVWKTQTCNSVLTSQKTEPCFISSPGTQKLVTQFAIQPT